jgi:large-conductance mechanosensitive channel
MRLTAFFKNKVLLVVFFISIIIISTLIFITIQAVVETENWKIFDIDYTNKEKVISGYSALLGAILSSLSIIFLVYTIYLQNVESKKQKKRFKKEHKLQKQQFEIEKLREEKKERANKFSLIKLISVFLDSVIKHIEETSVELLNFIEAEKENPIKMNTLFFLVNKSITKLIEMDHLSIFKGFEYFFIDDREWIQKYQRLFNSVGFYNDALLELRTNYDYHKTNKFSRKKKIGVDLKNLMDESSRFLNRNRNELTENYLEYPYVKIINEFIPAYYEYLNEYQSTGEETDFDHLSQNLLKRFLEKCAVIRKQIGFDDFGIEEIITQVSSIRKEIWSLKNDCIYFANNNEERYKAYFSPESSSLIKLKELKSFLDKRIEIIEVKKI